MQAIFLEQFGHPDKAFSIKDIPDLVPGEQEVLIKVESFGLNFADIMARKGLYRDCPPLPAVIGYEVVGRIQRLGAKAQGFNLGDRVVAMTRFGGYASHAITPALGAVKIPEEMEPGIALALVTQYGTAYYMAEEMVRLRKGDRVLIHAAAGGVGTALVQIAKYRGCEIFGTASPAKHDYLKKMGVDHPIDYRSQPFQEGVKSILGDQKLDVIFDPIGGKSFKEGMKLLGATGKMLAFGGSTFTEAKGFLGKLRGFLQFGFYHPLKLIGQSQSIIGVNLLRLGDHKPAYLQEIIASVLDWANKGILTPTSQSSFSHKEIAQAHAFFESRQSIGKIAVHWESDN